MRLRASPVAREALLAATVAGIVSAVLVWLGLRQFVTYPEDTPLAGYSWAVNLGLMGIIW